ncbi:MAG: undecaprenyldiphospho-muramoylpentapeptide beta-N-acetylglucosaminyltransferase [Rhizomicrobium sp.]|jgi:UDP-N-acetylglucosamine--N-acetylmuramyl-(pentapeptide) pyrophosphoryl-undecaprenol N-acetylglucosamine transferase
MTTIVLSAGGTGGHLFPAQALALELVRRGRRIVVMTDSRGKNYQSAFPGASIEAVPSASFASSSFAARVIAPFEILRGIIVGWTKLRRLKPAAVVGFGGYPSLPVMVAAWLAGCPSAVHEQNAILGRVNRQMAPRVQAVAASFPLAKFAAKNADSVVYTGNPVRPEVAALSTVPYAAPAADGTINLLVFGGSQGARAISALVPAAITLLPEGMRARLDIVQQCRPEDIDSVRAAYESAHVKAELAVFFSDLPKRIAAAHLVISRSGASTISELAAIGRPSILIPFPFATDDHQTANAEVMVKAGAAELVQQRDLSAEKLAGMIEADFNAPQMLVARAASAHALARLDAAARLADLVDRLGEGRS